MKILILSLSLLLILAVSTVFASDEDLMVVDENQTTSVNNTALNLALAGQPSGVLTSPEEEGLLFMAEEEKLAEDIYSSLNEIWSLRVFDNIGRAERTHQAAVETLLVRYSLAVPANPPGEFSNETLQSLYNDLVSRGGLSVEEALRVGASIEELDILDLEERMAQTDKEDIRLVYSNLKRGSENHLRAFVNNLERRGIEYRPEYLSLQEYDGIISG
ncbi:MAG TPA: DUF2202 domain-containing protein [Methanothrix soehngenii]|nr:DUF2202 domain-containing protein [Methanothrix soehngenii]